MPIDQKTVAKIAQLARLKIPEDEQKQVAGELSKIFDWVTQLDEVDIARRRTARQRQRQGAALARRCGQ